MTSLKNIYVLRKLAVGLSARCHRKLCCVEKMDGCSRYLDQTIFGTRYFGNKAMATWTLKKNDEILFPRSVAISWYFYNTAFLSGTRFIRG